VSRARAGAAGWAGGGGGGGGEPGGEGQRGGGGGGGGVPLWEGCIALELGHSLDTGGEGHADGVPAFY